MLPPGLSGMSFLNLLRFIDMVKAEKIAETLCGI